MKTFAIAALAVGMAATAASADPTYSFQYNDGDSGSFGRNDNGGAFESISSTFHPATNRLTFEVVFSNTVTEGFTLAINNGSNPKGHANEMALFYFDAADQNDVNMTAYVYSGQNNANSYQTQALIEGLDDTGWINSLSASDNGGERTLAFDVDATGIIDYSNHADWTGAQFTDAFGIWLHPFRTFNVNYDTAEGSNKGGINSFLRSGQGWFDGSDFGVTVIPLPTGAAMAGLGLAGLASRRRRA